MGTRLTSYTMEGGKRSRDIYTSSMLSPLRLILPALVLSLQITLYSTVSAQDGQIRCDVPSAKLHGNTSLTCHFPEDVSQTKTEFSVYRYTDKNTPYEILDCWWMPGKVECRNAHGYEYNKIVSDRLSLEILQVSAPQVATYACQLPGYGPGSIVTCELSVELDGMSQCEILSAKLNSQTALTCYFPEDLSKTRVDFSVYRHSRLDVSDRVLSCIWTGDSPTCTTALGYLFDKKVTSHLTLQIPSALEVHEGTYSCQTASAVSSKTCSFALKQDNGYKGKASCNISSVKENEPATLTCVFSYDISVTKDNFEVVRLDGKGPNVASCTWTNGKLECTTATGFDVNKTVTDHVIIRLSQATPDHTGQYACRLQGSDDGGFTPCALIVMPGDPHDDSSAGVAAAVITLLLLIGVIAAILFVLWRKGKLTCKQPSLLPRVFKEEEQGSPERVPMVSKKYVEKKDETTENFLNYLSDDFTKNYPDFETKSYLVPPLYFNSNTYIDGNIGGKHVYLTQPPDKKTAKHDEAMARVLHSFSLLAEQEVMFVISQFNYDNYLATPGQDFHSHKLPVPADLRSQDKHFGDFDILIVHRHGGVVVGVVKACGDDPEEANDTMIVEELIKGCEKLNNAHSMLKHLLSSDQSEIDIHKILILPNLSRHRLGRVLQGSDDMAKDLADCLGISESSDLRKECLCAELLSDINGVMELKNFLSRRLMRSKYQTTVDQYVTILSRFCGPSTHWTLKIPGYPRKAVLSTAFKHSLSMTGDLFCAPVLQPEQWDALNDHSPRVFLTGPPASGKTRMLVLTGIRWMTEGHTVHVVSTCKESRAATEMIHAELSRVLQEKQLPGAVNTVFFDKEDTKERIKQMIEKAANGSLYIIADEPDSYEKQPNFKDFVDSLQKKVPALNLRAASYFPRNVPVCCKTQAFTKSLTCPPSILLQSDVTKVVSKCGITAWRPDMRTTAPTEGPPIKFVYHSNEGHKGDNPGVCEKCATEVEKFLPTSLICKEVDCSKGTEGSSHLHYKDVLILFEYTTDIARTPMFRILSNAGIKVKVLDKDDPVTSARTATNDEILATKGKHMLGIKKKVVIYVEEKTSKSNKTMSAKWKRLRGLTSSTSQLIWVKKTKNSIFYDIQ